MKHCREEHIFHERGMQFIQDKTHHKDAYFPITLKFNTFYFSVLPSNESLDKQIDFKDGRFDVRLTFKEVFPLPTCKLNFNVSCYRTS